MRIADSRDTATKRHSVDQVPPEDARTIRWTAGGGASPRHREPRTRLRRYLAVGSGLVVVAVVAVIAMLVPAGPDTSPPGNTALTADVPNGPTGSWGLVFHDEFDGTSLDTTKWLPCVSHGQLPYAAECTGWKNELQRYTRDNVRVRGGALHLVGTRDGDRYASGAITTARDVFGFDQPGYREFTHTYGYTEVRFRSPAGPGTWPAVWGLPYNSDGDEIDHFEIVKDSAFFSLHTESADTGGQYELTGTNFTRGWHIIGTEWEPGRITWYVDGEPVYTVTSGVPDQPFFVQANLALGGDWPGPPTVDTRFPASFDIDYIRVFQRKP